MVTNAPIQRVFSRIVLVTLAAKRDRRRVEHLRHRLHLQRVAQGYTRTPAVVSLFRQDVERVTSRIHFAPRQPLRPYNCRRRVGDPPPIESSTLRGFSR
jgi:hypothetical protein